MIGRHSRAGGNLNAKEKNNQNIAIINQLGKDE